MELDLVIRNGHVVDGSGAPGSRGDVGIVGDRIVAVGEVDGSGREELDADGLVVAPGFVDGHTHMDAQVFWDQLGSSSCWQGVTTLVMGNCGYTLAPAHPEERVLVMRNIERAEDISARDMEQGMTWAWTTFAEYLDAVDGLPKGLNYAASIGHSALRIWAMGERAFEANATDDDLAVMERELRDALAAGAVGFTTSRNPEHTTSDDRPVASRQASWDELEALVHLVGKVSAASFQIGGAGGDPSTYARLRELALSSGVPMLFPVAARANSPGMAAIEEAVARGGRMYGLTHCREVGALQSFLTKLSFDTLAEWKDVRRRPLEEQRKLLEDPDVRARLVRAAHDGDYRSVAAADPRKPDYDKIFIMYSAYLRNPSVAEEARRRGVDPVEVMIDAALEHDFNLFFSQVFVEQDDDELVKLLRNPNTVMTFTDAGAHLSQVADTSIQTHLLAYWVRERQAIRLEEAIRTITHQSAKAWNLHDRGLLAPGYAADVTIFDAETVAPLPPRIVDDLPAGGSRLEQRAEGYAATIVNGVIFTRDGKATEQRPGRLLRAGKIPIPA